MKGRSQLECRRVFLRSLTRRLCPASPLSRTQPHCGPQPPHLLQTPPSVFLRRGPTPPLITRALHVTYSCCGRRARPHSARPSAEEQLHKKSRVTLRDRRLKVQLQEGGGVGWGGNGSWPLMLRVSLPASLHTHLRKRLDGNANGCD